MKVNVLFFDRKPAQEKPWTQKLWIHDLRTNMHFTLKENPLKRSDLDDFVGCYFGRPGSSVSEAEGSRHNRVETERFKSFTYDDLMKRDKVNLDIFWLKDDALGGNREEIGDRLRIEPLSLVGARGADQPGTALNTARRGCVTIIRNAQESCCTQISLLQLLRSFVTTFPCTSVKRKWRP